MKKFIEEFQTFAMRGNVLDLAVAVVIGGAFGKIVSSLVENIITPLIGFIVGGVNFEGLSFSLGGATVTYGAFLQSVGPNIKAGRGHQWALQDVWDAVGASVRPEPPQHKLHQRHTEREAHRQGMPWCASGYGCSGEVIKGKEPYEEKEGTGR